jgi:hypothetical protein
MDITTVFGTVVLGSSPGGCTIDVIKPHDKLSSKERRGTLKITGGVLFLFGATLAALRLAHWYYTGE